MSAFDMCFVMCAMIWGNLPKVAGVAGKSTTWLRLASREYCKPTVAGDIDITDSIGSASEETSTRKVMKVRIYLFDNELYD